MTEYQTNYLKKRSSARLLPRFSPEELDAIERILSDPQKIPYPCSEGDEPQTRKEHFAHCMQQIRRFARMLQDPNANIDDLWTRLAQLSMNYGRAQELIGSVGGRRMWWAPFEEIWELRDWVALEWHVQNAVMDINLDSA